MQSATAEPAPRCPGGGRKVAVEDEQLLMELGVSQHGLVHWSILCNEVGEMAKIGRNDPCACGSGKKYKKCCMARDEAAALAARAVQPAAAPARLPSLASTFQEHDELDELTEASNAVVDMVQAGDLDAAEQAARDLLARFPDVHDGYDRLGMVCEARGDHRQAADYYRRAITVIRDHPDNYDPGFDAAFQKLVDRLETQANAADG
jgi:tetratricopeptide (TPR) repeat protein